MTGELIDVVDDEDNVIRQVTWEEMNAGSLLHRTANIFVFNSRGEIFVHKRSRNLPLYPGMHDAKAGGIVMSGEGYEDGAKRELREELGIVCPKLEYLFMLKFRSQRNNNNRKVYRCVYDGKITLQKEEIEEGRFTSLDEAKRMLESGQLSPSGAAVFREFLKRQK